jgi:hypothetical protein
MRINPHLDEMVPLTDEMKLAIKRMGYSAAARLLAKTEGYMRYLASNGKRKIRKTDLDVLRNKISGQIL